MEKNLNWGYKTTPQEHCNGRELDYSRGKGLGGSSAINFGVYSVGARDDYNEWASAVGDDTFGWKEMQTRFKNLETFNGGVTLPENKKYANSVASDHGSSGGLRVGYAEDWERDLSLSLDAFEAAGHKLNLDHNSGNPLGMAATINSAYKGKRTTAVDLLSGAPDNLAVVTDSPVQRILLQGKKAVGVETQGKQCMSHPGLLSLTSSDVDYRLRFSGRDSLRRLTRHPEDPNAFWNRTSRRPREIQHSGSQRAPRYWPGSPRPLLRSSDSRPET
jgi:choline dehydrogenase-like flavoprotein